MWMDGGAFDCMKKWVSRTPQMNERTLLAELDLVDRWCTKVSSNAVVQPTSASPAVGGSISGMQASILIGFPLGVVRTFRPLPCYGQAKNIGSFDGTSCPGGRWIAKFRIYFLALQSRPVENQQRQLINKSASRRPGLRRNTPMSLITA